MTQHVLIDNKSHPRTTHSHAILPVFFFARYVAAKECALLCLDTINVEDQFLEDELKPVAVVRSSECIGDRLEGCKDLIVMRFWSIGVTGEQTSPDVFNGLGSVLLSFCCIVLEPAVIEL